MRLRRWLPIGEALVCVGRCAGTVGATMQDPRATIIFRRSRRTRDGNARAGTDTMRRAC
jgi:hypothetical protein